MKGLAKLIWKLGQFLGDLIKDTVTSFTEYFKWIVGVIALAFGLITFFLGELITLVQNVGEAVADIPEPDVASWPSGFANMIAFVNTILPLSEAMNYVVLIIGLLGFLFAVRLAVWIIKLLPFT